MPIHVEGPFMTPPRRVRTAACLLVACLVVASLVGGLAACSDDESASTTTSFAIDTPATVDIAGASTTVFPPVATIGPVTTPAPNAAPAGTADIPLAPTGTGDIPVVPESSTDAPVLIGIVVGEGTGPQRVEVVPLGSTVSLSVVNNTAADEFHVHGYDLGDGQEFAAGQTATFTFTADVAGDFELESHAAAHNGSPVLMILRVQ
jgi:hypothetical protein